MADVRALLKAKRQEARISHPYAAYSSSGQLRCTTCGTTIKQASMWEGHIGSKAHRVNVIKLRERERQEAEVETYEEEEEMVPVREKRKMDGENEYVDNKKRRKSEERNVSVGTGLEPVKAAKGGFPSDFFSDAARTLPVSGDDDDDDEAEEEDIPVPPAPAAKSRLELELEMFEAAVVNAPDEEKEDDRRDAFERATVFAEPELAPEVPEGFPVKDGAGSATEEVGGVKEESEEEKRKRKEQEDREIIMDRLMEEERAQEEADSRVELLKRKMEALKKARADRRAMVKSTPKA